MSSNPHNEDDVSLAPLPQSHDEYYRLSLSSGEALVVLALLQAIHPLLSRMAQSDIDPAILPGAIDRLAEIVPEFTADRAKKMANDLSQRFSSTFLGVSDDLTVDTSIFNTREPLSIQDKVTALELALENNSSVEIYYYVASRDEWTRRTVEIESIYEDNGNWYLDGFCRLRHGQRVFRVDNIARIRIQDE
jgi:hypothetical protein